MADDRHFAAAAQAQADAEAIIQTVQDRVSARLKSSDPAEVSVEAITVLLSAAWLIGKSAHPEEMLARSLYADHVRTHVDCVVRLGRH